MASSLKIRLNEFFVESKNLNRSHTLFHAAQPDTEGEAEKKGSFFAIFEIEHGNPRITEYAQDLLNFLEKFYYEEFAGERNHFEDTVLHANQLLRGFETPPGTVIHAIIGLIRGSDLSFSTHGNPGIWLFGRGTKRAHSLMPENTEAASASPAPNQDSFFSELAQGTLGIQDITLFASTHLLDYFTPDRLTKIVHGHDSAEISRHLGKTLKELESGLSFAGVVLEAVPLAPARPQGGAILGSHASIEALLTGQDKTAEFLTPTVFRNAWDWLDEQWKARPKKQKYAPEEAKNPGARTAGKERGENDLLLGHLLWYLLRNILIFIFRLLRGVFLLFWRVGLFATAFFRSSRDDRRALKSALTSKTKGRFASFFERYRTLNSKQQFTVLLVGVLIIAVVGGGGTLFYKQVKEKRESEYAALVKQITKNQEEAEAKIIYGADPEARALLIDAQKLLVPLVKLAGKSHKQEYAELEGTLETTLAELRKEIPVTPIVTLAIPGEMLPAPRTLGLFKNTFMLASASAPQAILVMRDSKEIKTMTVPEALGNPTAGSPEEVYWQGRGALYRAKQDGSIEKVFDVAARDFAVFGKRLYTLQPEQEQIMVHAAQGTAFAAGSAPWIKETTVLPLESTHLVIDGDMYVLNTTGSVEKFHRGVSMPFNFTPLDPTLRTVTRVATTEESQRIYILDANEGRIVVFDKDGKLKAQYKSDDLKRATDFALDEKAKTAYLVNDTGIAQFELGNVQ